MIKNEKQHKITKAKIRGLKLDIANLKQDLDAGANLSAQTKRMHLSVGQALLSDLKAELSEYENLRSGNFDVDTLAQVDYVPFLLIKARIASGMTQKDLANRLKVKEPQIQNYESTEYTRASLARMRDIARILRTELQKDKHNSNTGSIHKHLGTQSLTRALTSIR